MQGRGAMDAPPSPPAAPEHEGLHSVREQLRALKELHQEVRTPRRPPIAKPSFPG